MGAGSRPLFHPHHRWAGEVTPLDQSQQTGQPFHHRRSDRQNGPRSAALPLAVPQHQVGLREGPKITYYWEKWLWLAGLLFHYSFLVVFLRHLRFFTEPVPFFVTFLDKAGQLSPGRLAARLSERCRSGCHGNLSFHSTGDYSANALYLPPRGLLPAVSASWLWRLPAS